MTRPRWAVIVWTLILLVLGLRAGFSKKVDGVYPIFSAAGRHWLAGETAYGPPTPGIDQYRYSPAVTGFLSLWAMIPERAGCLLWRAFNAAVLLAGLCAWGRTLRPAANIAVVALLVLPLAIGGLNNAQVNALDVGFLLLAAAAFARGRFTLAAACITVPVLFKGYPIALGLLFCLIEPRKFTPRLALCILLGTVLPFACQRPGFVWQEYANFVSALRVDDRTQWDIVAGYRDLQMLLRRFGMPLSLQGYRVLELALAAGCAGLVMWRLRSGRDRATATEAGTSLALCWMTLAGPATESCTYVVIAPVLAVALLTAARRAMWQRALVAVSYVLFTIAAASVWFPGWIAHPIQMTAIQPLAALLLTAHVVIESVRRPASAAEDHFFSGFGRSASSSRTAA